MHEKVQEFLNQKKEEEKKEKEKNLIRLGLYEKVYSSDNKYSDQYSYSEWDSETATNRFFQKMPIQVTEEEYNEILKYSNHCKDNSDESFIATVIKIIAIILYVFGFIAGMIVAEESAGMMFVIWILSFITGTAYLGFAEIINLLKSIKNK